MTRPLPPHVLDTARRYVDGDESFADLAPMQRGSRAEAIGVLLVLVLFFALAIFVPELGTVKQRFEPDDTDHPDRRQPDDYGERFNGAEEGEGE